MLLRPLVEADLPVVAPWFQDLETARWLGGPDWPAESLKLAGPSRGSFLALVEDRPIGLIDVEIYVDGRASFANVIAPAQRRRGFGRELIVAMMAHPDYAQVMEFFAGIERGNAASERLVLSAGFTQVSEEDDDGFTYFARRRDAAPTRPWVMPD